MKKILTIILLSQLILLNSWAQDAAYLRSQTGEPWGVTENIEAMDDVFGAGNWTSAFFQTVNPNVLFSASHKFVFIDGSDSGTNAMFAFLAANGTLIENWVAQGNTLYLNSASNQTGGNVGFNNVTFNNYIDHDFSVFSSSATVTNPSHPIFSQAFQPISNNYIGNFFAHDLIDGPGLNTIMVGDGNNVAIPDVVLAEKFWGNGAVIFGGLTTPNWQGPNPAAENLRRNILLYLYDFFAAVQSFTLVDSWTDTDVAIAPGTPALENGETFNLATIAPHAINIRANTVVGAVGSVKLQLTGPANKTIIENVAPYALFGDHIGNYDNWTPPVGTYTLTATPYSGANATGTAGTPLTITFHIINSRTVESFTLVNATTDTDIPVAPGTAALENGETVDMTGLSAINIRANTNPPTVGSVKFVVTGPSPLTLTENAAPYAVFGDNSGNYNNWVPKNGNYTLTATPYSGSNATGSPGTALSINFTVTNSPAGSRLDLSQVMQPGALQQLRAYPNPTPDGRLKVQMGAQESGKVKYSLVSATGQVVETGTMNMVNRAGLLDFDFSNRLKSGMYYLRLEGDTMKKEFKIVRQ